MLRALEGGLRNSCAGACRQLPRGQAPVQVVVLLSGGLKPPFLSSEPGLCPHPTPALSLQCYLCGGTQTATQCLVMTCGQGHNVCYKGDLISTWQDGEFPAPRAGWAVASGASWKECGCVRCQVRVTWGCFCTEEPAEASWRRRGVSLQTEGGPRRAGDHSRPQQGQRGLHAPTPGTVFLLAGKKIKMKLGGCAPSCEEVSKETGTKASPGPGLGPMDNILEGLGPLAPKFEVQGVSCCEKDLCNGVSRAGRSLWALAGGLLLSLGPALLWALV